MKVLMVSRALLAAAYRQKLVELHRLGVEVVAVVPSRWKEGAGYGVLEAYSALEYRLIGTTVQFNGHFHAHFYPWLGRIVRAEQPDLLHLDEEPYNLATFLGTRIAQRLSIPSLFFTWQNINRRYPVPFRSMEQAVYRGSRCAIAGSEEAAQVLRYKGFRSSIAVIPQFGVDPESFHPGVRTDHDFTVGFLNRLIVAKGPWVAMEALSALPSDIKMLVVGDGPLRPQLLDAAQSRGLTDRIEFRHRVPSSAMPDLLRHLDVVILPSLTTTTWKEQFGRILIEAMACGVPVIGSQSGEIPTVVGDAGLLVPEGDAVALAQRIREIHSDGVLRGELIRRGRERVLREFTHAEIARRTKEVYEEALSSSAAG